MGLNRHLWFAVIVLSFVQLQAGNGLAAEKDETARALLGVMIGERFMLARGLMEEQRMAANCGVPSDRQSQRFAIYNDVTLRQIVDVPSIVDLIGEEARASSYQLDEPCDAVGLTEIRRRNRSFLNRGAKDLAEVERMLGLPVTPPFQE